ncbi:N-acetylneuraminate synthase [Phaeobacter gallaeciensis]|uniref:N-acetylneuraminate synthase n=2 Tax=Roseobacteraceae TaxID=2854170 RepID=A0A366WKC9_9RHOB|nr:MULTISPECIES: N-acetylneuraminate synthase family protein [Roseobacteraceae]MBT3141769.1 N-acetylneuraminate synthase family protein [Falsiruegeria litorea]MBT8167145.1 N-acetylneuraminate synthase family protein [Falsiruegeria litorea]RBW50300.1 N-acetylneuraminate synthase [Phaeobacter gallaeciensis]
MALDKTPVQVIAEIGCNHKGDMDIAKDLIRVAATVCGAHVAKFQKRHNRELLSPVEYDTPHPVPSNAYGDTYGAHRDFLEMDVDQHKELIDTCKEYGIAYSTSVWDLTSAREMTTLNPPMLKIPSATNLHYDLQNYLCENFAGEIHVSTGMSTGDEIAKLVQFYADRGRAQDLVVYSCTSGYPVAFEDICLFEIRTLMEKFGTTVKGIGFSGHHLGIAADVAALAIGRSLESEGKGRFSHIERHFTLDRTWKGTDHAASLEPDGLRRLCRDVRNVDQALAYKGQDILPVEQVQRDKLKWGLS